MSHNKTTQWRINGELERAIKEFDSQFSFTRAHVEGELSLQLNRFSNFQLRALFGASSGNLPLYRHFYIGGYRWLRGFETMEFNSDSYWTTAADYGINLSGAGLKLFTFWLFYDIGNVGGNSAPNSPILESETVSSIGLGLSIDRTVRFNFARRLDRGDGDIRFSVEF